MYLQQILQKYQARDLTSHSSELSRLRTVIQAWAGSCFLEIKNSGSRAKGTAISLASDVDYLVSLKNGCNQNNGGLEFTYNQLYGHLVSVGYKNVRKQNASPYPSSRTLDVVSE